MLDKIKPTLHDNITGIKDSGLITTTLRRGRIQINKAQ